MNLICTSTDYLNEWNEFLNNEPDLVSFLSSKLILIGSEYFEIYGYNFC